MRLTWKPKRVNWPELVEMKAESMTSPVRG